ncbi:M15 family metallopeptidase [Christiangramia aquimixticola]|uniref:M15 family metallopeptidase n=1 Tax=Christiangramia aquimixticola TaxID=1697558 RepID=UPI003AA943B7
MSYSQKLPEGFVYIDEVIPDIIVDLRYTGSNNFMGRPVEGYENGRAVLSEKAAKALKGVQQELIKEHDFMLKIFDAYRPQRAVNDFVAWSKDEKDTLAKHKYYPDLAKSELFPLGYIASRSGHSRGSTVDLTLVKVKDCKEVDMGSPYDFFGDVSNHGTSKIEAEQTQHRELLRRIMKKHGFRSYRQEWWHYTFDAEPFPDTYFDFPVK